MAERTFYNEILTDHNLHPQYKKKIENPDYVLEGVNPSCGDDIFLSLRLSGDTIVDVGFEGDGCAISQASADMMAELVIGKTITEAEHYMDLFYRMIKNEASEEEIEELEEASVLQDISHMPARVKCAVLGWHTLEEMLNKHKA